MNFRIKTIIIGEPGVGKTSLVKKFISGHFSQDYRASIGTNLYVKEYRLNSAHNVTIQIWDIAGQEKWIKMRHLYYKGAHGALVVGDYTRENTFKQLREFWIKDLNKYCKNIPKILVVNKVDLDAIISDNDIDILAQEIDVKTTISTSAKNGHNVEEIFHQLTDFIIKSKV